MTAGVPGTGIGGLFYLAAALWLPVRAIIRQMRGVPASWRTILGNAGLALGILAGIWGTGLLLGWMLAPAVRGTGEILAASGDGRSHQANLVRWGAFLAGYMTLAVVLGAVQVARFLAGRKTT